MASVPNFYGLGFGLGTYDLGLEGPDLGLKGPDLGLEGPDLGLEGPDLGHGLESCTGNFFGVTLKIMN